MILKICPNHGTYDPATGCLPCKTTDTARRTARIKHHGYSSPNWQHIRTRRHQLAAGQCELQLPGCTTIATHTHLNPTLAGDHRHAQLEDTRACCANCSGAIDAPRATHRGGGSDTHHQQASATRARHPRETLGMV